ncbi:hypothetical protein B0T16DRAFT_422414 [Cercophora newfieldiana]|uniref:Uncharacterized protein n=1 Tax=Cercophora newfieldiana TaxID=92897 RepID=A0AA39XRW3_9PEZI|nr:hypothetical protein B0T16DRAFT_422414 [Cercophora newfieldiana]
MPPKRGASASGSSTAKRARPNPPQGGEGDASEDEDSVDLTKIASLFDMNTSKKKSGFCVGFHRRFGTLTQDEFDDMLRLPDDPQWTDEMQANLMATWEGEDAMRQCLETEKTGNVKDQVTLWKEFCQFFRRVPTDLIGVDYFLARVPEAASRNNPQAMKRVACGTETPVWASTFCQALRDILLHPLWEDSIGTLAMVLQFAVIVRTNDKRTWPLVNKCGTKFVDRLIDEIKKEARLEPTARRSIEYMCKDANRRGGDEKKCQFYRLFMRICRAQSVDRVPILEGSFLDKPYCVKTEDLKVIGDALESLGSYEKPAMMGLDFIHDVTTFSRNEAAPPAVAAFIPDVLPKVVLRERRKRQLKLLSMPADEDNRSLQSSPEPEQARQPQAPGDRRQQAVEPVPGPSGAPAPEPNDNVQLLQLVRDIKRELDAMKESQGRIEESQVQISADVGQALQDLAAKLPAANDQFGGGYDGDDFANDFPSPGNDLAGPGNDLAGPGNDLAGPGNSPEPGNNISMGDHGNDADGLNAHQTMQVHQAMKEFVLTRAREWQKARGPRRHIREWIY